MRHLALREGIMKLSRRLMTPLILIAWLMPCRPVAADPLDSQIHSEVSQKVQRDHAQEVKSGKFRSHSGRSPAYAQAQATASTSSLVAPVGAAHPVQVKQMQTKQSAPAPVKTTPAPKK
jgi:hypothetical protein